MRPAAAGCVEGFSVRVVFGVAASLAAMSLICLLFLVPLFLVLGPSRALAAGGVEFSTLWTGIAMVVCLGAAALGGWLAHRVAGSVATVVIVTLVLLLGGLGEAVFHQFLMTPVPLVPGRDSWLEWVLRLREPAWYDWSLPVLMATFAWIAGSGRAIEAGQIVPDKSSRKLQILMEP